MEECTCIGICELNLFFFIQVHALFLLEICNRLNSFYGLKRRVQCIRCLVDRYLEFVEISIFIHYGFRSSLVPEMEKSSTTVLWTTYFTFESSPEHE